MGRDDQPGRENEELRDRFARLSAAILRISASLELDAVLHEVVDSARALTGARCGVIATVDEAGQAQDFVSSGLSPQEHRQLAEWPDGPRLFEHLRSLPGTLRLPDLNGYVRSVLEPGRQAVVGVVERLELVVALSQRFVVVVGEVGFARQTRSVGLWSAEERFGHRHTPFRPASEGLRCRASGIGTVSQRAFARRG